MVSYSINLQEDDGTFTAPHSTLIVQMAGNRDHMNAIADIIERHYSAPVKIGAYGIQRDITGEAILDIDANEKILFGYAHVGGKGNPVAFLATMDVVEAS